MAQFTALLAASDVAQATDRVLSKLGEGFKVLEARVASPRHLLHEVLVEAPEGFDRNDTWVLLTSYGISPSADLGSAWQTVAGVGAL